MARKHTIPGVDEAALSELARQFPSHDVEPPPPLSQEQARSASAAPNAGRRGGAGVALAIVVALVAVAVAAAPIVAPAFRTEITQALGDGPLVQMLWQGRSDIDRAVAAERTAQTELERRVVELVEKGGADLRAVTGRVAVIEAAGGGGFDMAARRIEAAEAATTAAAQRLAAVESELTQSKDSLALLGKNIDTVKSSVDALGTASAADRAALQALFGDLEKRITTAVGGKTAALADQVDAAAAVAGDAAQKSAEAVQNSAEAAQKATEVEQSFGELRQFNRSSVRLFLIALHLRTAIQTPAPFARELAAVRSVVGDNPEAVSALAVLSEHANGVRTLADLRDAFRSTSGAQVKSLAASLDGSWTSRLTAMMAGPQPPRTGEGERVWQVVVQAEQALAQGNLAAAINHVDRFDGPAGVLVVEWLRDAKARLAVENAAATLSIHALNQLVNGS